MSKGRMCPMMFMGRSVTPTTPSCSYLEKACAWYIVDILPNHKTWEDGPAFIDFSHCAIESAGRDK